LLRFSQVYQWTLKLTHVTLWQYLGDLPEAPWDREELHSIYPEIPRNGVLFEHHMESYLKGKPWALYEDGDRHPKDCQLTKTKWVFVQITNAFLRTQLCTS
jgi:hypothetical protein